MAFDAAERNGRFDHIRCQRSEKSSSRGKRKRKYSFCRRTVRVEIKSKFFPTTFLNIEGRGTFALVKDEKKRNS